MIIPNSGETRFLVLQRSLYDICLCTYDTGLMMSESDIFGDDSFSGTDTLGTDPILGPPSYLVQLGVQQLLIVELNLV